MATSYTTFLGLALPVTGELSGTWGDTVNNYISNYIDAAVAGAQTVTTNTTLTKTTGSSLDATSSQYAIIIASPASANITITAPAASKIYTIINTSGTYTVKIVGAGPTTGVTLGVSEKAQVAWNGSDFIKISNTGGAASFTNVTVTGTTTLSGLTASTALALDASKNVVSVTNTGTGNNVLSASPTLTGTTAGASLSLSSLTSGRVTYATTAGLLTDSANLLYSGTDLTVYGITVGRGAGAVFSNTSVGASALAANTTGVFNTAFGYEALAGNTDNSANTAIGYRALKTQGAAAFQNTAVGAEALTANTTGTNNTGIGRSALLANTTGGSNAAVGFQALGSNTTASNNTAIGYQAGYSNTTGTAIDAFGSLALYSNSTGGSNVAVGRQALYSNTTASNNTAVGGASGYSNTTGSDNVFMGAGTAFFNTTGSYNTVLGRSALFSNTTASNNTAVGYQAGYANTTAVGNTFIGYQSGVTVTTGTYNIGVGVNSGPNLSTATGTGNVYIGVGAGASLTTGTYNTFVGASGQVNQGSGGLITTGSKNTILGPYNGNQGGLDIRTASNCIVLSDGDGNPRQIIDSAGVFGFGGKVPDAWTNSASVIQGYGWSISTNGTNSNSVDFTSNAYRSGGTTSFKYEGSSTATNYKQSVGEHQWYNAPSGTAGNAITFTQAMTLDASGNLLVGTTSLLSNANYFAYSPGNAWGIFGHVNGTASGIDFAKFYYNNTQIGSISQSGTTAVLYNLTSDQRLKENIQDADSASSLIDAIQVRKFYWKSDGSHQRYGFVAQELVSVAPEAVHQPADPEEMMAVDYSKLVPMLVKEIQSLRIRIAQLEAQ